MQAIKTKVDKMYDKRYEKMNETIFYQKIPASSIIRQGMPGPKSLLEMKEYKAPTQQ
jgi:hypothetical protein